MTDLELAELKIRFSLARVVIKKTVWHQRLIGFFLPRYRNAITTIGNTIYTPSGIMSESVKLHEAVHLKQFDRHGKAIMAVLYLCSPLPIGFCYGRYVLEREAYMVQMAYGWKPDRIAREICSALYLWPWPKKWVQKWFEEQRASEV